MSKIAKQKALEAYPIDIIPDDDTIGFTSSDRNEIPRLGYIKCYDQAMQDFMEKACEWLKDQACYYSHWEYNGDTYEKEIVVDTDNLIDGFKNYMQDESEK